MKTLLAGLLIFASVLLSAADDLPFGEREPGDSPDNPIHGCYSGRVIIGSDQHPDQKFAEYMVDDGSVILIAISNDEPFYVVPSERCSDYQDPK